ncbi:mitochondrial intermediate peptidase [Neodiprion lecontei]|uniref:Mitochondrial intermediate peptidase n=1 Tax=Neodiprion lecontei TaxID=441921 RepID=A0A6J0CDS9_NEOLC|nr:mitochondrial intermediate peptidase [Neodiprion lecontei]XP_015524763.1 mitochondrial intermediate peptidase [Neodiprion lecontei]XP_046588895.1 mitochondrial intermediate peptidase [Neodiprion lecontei]
MLMLIRNNVVTGLRRKYRDVSTWSSLATAFNTKSVDVIDSLVSRKETGLFGIPELDDAEGFDLLKRRAMAQTDELIEEATSQTRSRKIVEIFDELSDSLCKVADLAEFVRIAHPDRKFSDAAEDACITISGVVEKLNTHKELYNSLLHVVKNGDVVETTEVDEHVAKLFAFDFEQCGIHLIEEQRQKVVHLNDRILQTGQRFMAGTVHPRAVKKDVLPPEIRQYFTTEGGQILVQGLYTDSSNAIAREAAYKIFLYPDSQQELLLRGLLNDRHDLSEICGFPSYAHRAVRGSTVEKPEVVYEFLNILSDQLKHRAHSDFQIMQQMKNAETGTNQDLMAWDTAYFIAKAKKAWLNTSSAEFAPYFSLGTCMEGLNTLTQALYGVKLEPEPVVKGEVWASDIRKLAVVDDVQGTLGYIYCDFYERMGKPNQDCHFTIRGGKQLPDGSYQNPIVVLMLSLPSPRWSSPSLLSSSSVDNLFHEMGHALHSMLGRTQYQHVTGTRCSTDFAEVPSVLMEYFASDPRVVSTFAKHFQTQEPIPDDMLHRLCASKHLFPASELQNQVFYSMLDQVYHSRRLEQPSTEILADLQDRYYGLPYVQNTAWQLRFSHLVGYGAKYYSYLISRAIASWIWQTYFEADPFSRLSGERYRTECLAHGGGKSPSILVSDFLSKDANAQNFAKSLINEIDAKNDHMHEIKNITS